jgi:hypothetical protein
MAARSFSAWLGIVYVQARSINCWAANNDASKSEIEQTQESKSDQKSGSRFTAETTIESCALCSFAAAAFERNARQQ